MFLFVNLMGCALGSSQTKTQEKANLHLKMASSLMANGRLPEAMSELTMAEELDPSHPEIQNNLGLVFQLRERFDEAEKRYRRALKLDPKYTDVRTNLARLYIDQGRYQEALKEIQIVENDLTYPAPEKGLTLKGIAFFKMGNYNQAEEILTKAYKIERKSCLGSYFLGRAYYERKKFKEASQVLDQAIDNCEGTKFEEPLFFSAMAYYHLGDRMQTRARAEKLLKEHPKSDFSQKTQGLLKIVDGL